MKNTFVLFFLFILASFLLNLTAKEIEGFSEYRFSDNETFVQAKKRCMELAKRDAIEKFATYINSETVVKDFMLDSDEITARSLGVVKNVTIVKDSIDRASSYIFYKIKGEIDENEVMKLLKEKSGTTIINSKIKDFIISGNKAENNLRIGDALKYYYWALLLLKSDASLSSKMKYEEFDKRLLAIVLPEKIENIFSSLKFAVDEINDSDKAKNVVLFVTYKNKAVSNIDFKYYAGDGWSNYIKVRNGLGVVELYGSVAKSLKKLWINTEYKYDNKSKFDDDVKKAIEKNSHIPFSSGSFKVKLVERDKTSNNENEKKEKILRQTQNDKLKTNIKEVKIIPDIHINIVEKVIEAIKTKKYFSVKKYFTESGFETFNDIVMYGNAKIVLDEVELTSSKIGKDNESFTIVRSIPMSFSFPRNDTKSIENVVFSFAKGDENKIDALSFALSDIAISDIMKKPEKFASKEEKYQLLQFMEFYKTAYCLKQLDYIESIFADNALIIVGKILKKGKNIGEMYDRIGNDKVKYIKMNKSTYVSHLKKVFSSNEFVNIHFEENLIKKVNGKKVYGIQIKQNYYSQNYSDKGYLFLMMDLSDAGKPKIYVRSWQPQKNEDGSVIGLEDFRIGG